MKITNFAILFFLIIFPSRFYSDMQLDYQGKSDLLERQYNLYLDTATEDAAVVLTNNENQQMESNYNSEKPYRANKEAALKAFYHSVYTNFEINDDPLAYGLLDAYIPAIAVVDFDGYWVYTDEEYKSSTGETILKHVWKPKKPYTYTDTYGNSFSFTLTDYIVVYEAATKTWHKGIRGEIASGVSIPLLQDSELFESIRRTTIINAIQNDLQYYINIHNEYATRYGVSYTFALPSIDQEDWVNTIDDIGIMAFIQGIPIGDRHYNNYALGGGQVFKKRQIIGAVDPGGKKVYYDNTCSYSYAIEESFDSAKDAAMKGYRPLYCGPLD